MSIKSILCAYSGEAAHGSSLQHAIKLAVHHGAHITGVLSHGRSLLERHYTAHIPNNLLDQMYAADADLVRSIEERFTDQTRAAGLNDATRFVELDPAKDGPLSEFAHTFDLIVTGVHSEIASDEHLSAHPDLLALKSGRPVLVVPDGYEALGLADHALVAWDGKRSAARAISEAMDILAEKAEVSVVSVGKTPRGTDRLLENMHRHGIDATAETLPRSGAVAKTLLEEADKRGAKLIVMGAFEHSKFSHDIIGGVTTDVTRDATVPVFMVH